MHSSPMRVVNFEWIWLSLEPCRGGVMAPMVQWVVGAKSTTWHTEGCWGRCCQACHPAKHPCPLLVPIALSAWLCIDIPHEANLGCANGEIPCSSGTMQICHSKSCPQPPHICWHWSFGLVFRDLGSGIHYNLKQSHDWVYCQLTYWLVLQKHANEQVGVTLMHWGLSS